MTDAEKAALEAADAKWERPPQEFIDRWNVRSNGCGQYNEESGYFELNGLTDIGYDEARDIDAKSTMLSDYISIGNQNAWSAIGIRMRTCYPLLSRGVVGFSLNWGYEVYIDIIRLGSKNYTPWNDTLSNAQYIANCIELWPNLRIEACVNLNGFNLLPRLRECRLNGLKRDIAFSVSKELSLESLQFLVENAANTAAITVTVHADVYAKLTDESNVEWHKVWTDAEAKNITFAQP